MYRFEVIDSENSRWDSLIRLSAIYDFYQTRFYHKIDNSYTSLMFIAENENDFVALPLVLRPIAKTKWSDLTSVYGYVGPISSRVNFDFEDGFRDFFQNSLKNYCKENNIVSIFSRMHPLLKHNDFLLNMGEVASINKTVVIDLKLPNGEQKRQYRKSTKSEINQCRRKGFNVEEATSVEDVEVFREIYIETMERVKASSDYYYSKEYFFNFLNNAEFHSRLLVAKFQGRIVAGAIFTITNQIMQYHLAGTRNEFIKERPMKLILDEARLLGTDLMLSYLNLGGGYGGSNSDSLFTFKSGFSKVQAQFSVWKYILNDDIYNELAANKIESSFFPLYRS